MSTSGCFFSNFFYSNYYRCYRTSFNFVNAKELTNNLSKTASKLIIQKLITMSLFMSLAVFPSLFFKPNIRYVMYSRVCDMADYRRL